jgi:hypothetical protein
MIIRTVLWGPEQLENKLGARPRDQAIRRYGATGILARLRTHCGPDVYGPLGHRGRMNELLVGYARVAMAAGPPRALRSS